MIMDAQTLEHKIASQARTYKDVAKAAGISEKTLKQARRGEAIRTATAGRIAAALGVSVAEILK